MEKAFESFADKFISERTEQLVLKAEHQSAFQKEMEQLHDLCASLSHLLGEEQSEELITAARGADVPIYEYCYKEGLKDGIRLNEMMERLKKR